MEPPLRPKPAVELALKTEYPSGDFPSDKGSRSGSKKANYDGFSYNAASFLRPADPELYGEEENPQTVCSMNH